MANKTKREQIARAKAARLMEQAQALGYFLKASVVRRRFRCGKAGCRCVRGYLHQDLIVTRRVAGISQTIRVRQGRETEALVWLENWRRLKKILSRLTDGLIVCGGFYSYGGGFFTGSVLEEMLPVTIKGPRDVKKLPLAMDVIPGDAVPGLPVLPPGNAGVVMWLHDVTAKPGTKVPLRAGAGDPSKPFLVTRIRHDDATRKNCNRA